MYTENKEDIIEHLTIVECKYDNTKEDGWKWIPIRLRRDKTEELRSGYKNYGNAYHVALSVWDSIHQPVSESMIKGEEDIPDISIGFSNDIYYNNDGSSSETKSLRNFHNQYVKRKLIMSVTQPGNTLIDIAVGKGGDISKWRDSKLSFVLGIDVSPDNIINRSDGACSRYIRYKQKMNGLFDAIFLHGDSSKLIKNGDAFTDENNRNIMHQLISTTPKDDTQPFMVKKYYGIGRDGFDVVSCQFAMHYFFKDKLSLHQFLVNVSDMCKVGGYFIGTCFDGVKIFEMMKNKKRDESMSYYKNDKEILTITKKYNDEFFMNDDSSLGYEIEVFQESINKTFSEYLVHFYYLQRIFAIYGFSLVSDKDHAYKKFGQYDGMPMFEDLYRSLKQEKATHSNKYNHMIMDSTEQSISFLNRAFIFKKLNAIPDYIRDKPQIVGDTETLSYPSRENRKEKMDIIQILNEQHTNLDQYMRFRNILQNLNYSPDFDSNVFMTYVFEQQKEHGLISDFNLYKGFIEYFKEYKDKQESDEKTKKMWL